MWASDVFGVYGEWVVAVYLVDVGMVIVECNWCCDIGEIDIIVCEGNIFVVCEVKTWCGMEYGLLLEKVILVKVEWLRRLVVWWMVASGVYLGDVRIDLVVVVWLWWGWV